MTYDATRRSLHGLAELVLAGPQYRQSGTIRLHVTEGGFGTVAEPALRVVIDRLVAGDQEVVLTGRTFRDVAAEVGLTVGAPAGLYEDGSGVDPDESITTADAAHLAAALRVGDEALRGFAPAETAVLWPEHFDLGVTLDEVNYGVSLGDTYLAEPYAYVGPWQPREGAFWTAPFGAARPVREFGDAAAVAAFFAEGRALTS